MLGGPLCWIQGGRPYKLVAGATHRRLSLHLYPSHRWRFAASIAPAFVFHEDYSIPWPERHRFPMWKYRDLAEYLVADGTVPSMAHFVRPEGEVPHEHVLLAHDSDYYWAFVEDRLDAGMMRRIGFAQREDHGALVRCIRTGVAGMVLSARLSLECGLACNLTGGTHHAHTSWGSGYNVVNDLAIAAKVLLDRGAVGRICIVDLDVHQGDGTAEICKGDPRIFTFSLHCGDNFPFGFKGLAHLGHDRSDLDIALPKGAGDIEFLGALREHLPRVLADCTPDLVLYQAGVDCHKSDELGRLCVSDAGLAERDRFVLHECLVERGIPVAGAVGGGYSARGQGPRRELSRRHATLCHAAVATLSHVKGRP